MAAPVQGVCCHLLAAATPRLFGKRRVNAAHNYDAKNIKFRKQIYDIWLIHIPNTSCICIDILCCVCIQATRRPKKLSNVSNDEQPFVYGQPKCV